MQDPARKPAHLIHQVLDLLQVPVYAGSVQRRLAQLVPLVPLQQEERKGESDTRLALDCGGAAVCENGTRGVTVAKRFGSAAVRSFYVSSSYINVTSSILTGQQPAFI